MLFRQMKYFIAVVEAHSFTEASYALEISQSAVSQQIKALEDDLGVPLLVRQNRTFSLTPAGEYFYRHGKELLQEIDAFQSQLFALPEFKNLWAMERMCRLYAQPTNEPTEFNLYAETAHLFGSGKNSHYGPGKISQM